MRGRIRFNLAALALLGLVACSGSNKGNGATKDAASAGRQFTLFVTGEVKGQLEPCGCTTDPLGDLARTVELIRSARSSGPVLYLDAGSLLYSDIPVPDARATQHKLKADLLRKVMQDELKPAAIGLGPYDFAAGKGAIVMPRHAANLSDGSGIPTEAPKIVKVGDIKVGVFGVVSPIAIEPFKVEAQDPIDAAKAAISELKKNGAEVIVGLAHMTRAETKALAQKAPGADFLIIGQNLPEPNLLGREPAQVGRTWMISPANRGQVITRFDVVVRPGDGPLGDALGSSRAKAEITKLNERIPGLEEKLTKWKADSGSDPAFVAQKESELKELKDRVALLGKKTLFVPKSGPYFTVEQVEIKRGLPCATEVVEAKKTLNAAVNKGNIEAAKGTKPPAPAKGEASYVGAEECSYCHADQHAFWKTTKHFQAWETLEKDKKEFDLDCIYCHVTGFDKPGGANLAVNEHLRDVQCETCHGPGSIHVEKDGNDKPRTVSLSPPEALCKGCHNEEHSDTFQYEAYLRDVTGKGHGEAFRKKLGEGDTGSKLRAAGLAKAGADIGKGCPK